VGIEGVSQKTVLYPIIEGDFMETTQENQVIIASERISEQISNMKDWRGEVLARLRMIIHEAAPGIAEEWKWGAAVWSQKGMVCSASPFKDHVKLNFFYGAALDDRKGLFNSGLDAKASRSIDFNKGEDIDESALKELIQNAVSYNNSRGKKK